MPKKHSLYLIGIIVVLITLCFTGCNALEKPIPNNTMPNQDEMGVLPDQLPDFAGQKLSIQKNKTKVSDIERAKNISKKITSIKNIKRGPVVIDGNKAIVGIQLNDNSDAKVNKMINEITNEGNKSNKNTSGLTNQFYNMLGLKTGQSSKTKLTLEDVISKKVKGMDPNITTVLVTTDKRLINRLDNLSNTIETEIDTISNKIQLKNSDIE